MTKAEIRARMKARRAEMTSHDARYAGECIAHIAADPMAADLFSRFHVFASFLNFGDEISTEALNLTLMRAGKVICVPRWSDTSNDYRWAPLAYETALRRGKFGIYEPASPTRFPRGEIQAIFVPGLAFDSRGGRIGFGGGYYDRFIAGLRPNVLKVGICYDFQIVDSPLPQDEHDIKMDLILSPSMWIQAHRAQRTDNEKLKGAR